MKAMVLHSPDKIEKNPLKLEDVEKPVPKKKEILIKVKVCGVCRTDLHTVEGEIKLKKLPIIPGHQIIGVVEEVGEEVRKFRKGERVGIPWLYSICGKCNYCIEGKENLCENIKFTGLDVDGGYAEYVISVEDFTYPVLDYMPIPNIAPLFCGGVIGYRAFKLSGVKEGESLGLYGFGNSAHIVLQIAKYMGIEVFVYTRTEKHKKHAFEIGADWVGNYEQTQPKKLDGVIIFAPNGDLVPHALRNIKKGGTVSLAGIYMTEIPQMEYNLIYGEKKLISVANSTREDVRGILDIAEKAKIKTDVHTFPLEEANLALRDVKHSLIKGSAVLIIP